MRKVLYGLALLAPLPLAAQTTPYRGQSGFDVGPVINCVALDGSGTAKCLVPSVALLDANGVPLGTAANPIYVSGGGGGGSTPTGPAGTPNTNVVTVQGIPNGTPQNIAATALPLPTGAATSANQATMIANQPGLATAGSAAPTTGTLLMGSDGTNARALKTGTDGTLVLGAGSNLIGNVNGTTPSGTADNGSPLKIGGYASSTAPTAVTAAQRVNAWYDLTGANFESFAPTASIGAGIAGTTAQAATSNTLKASAGNLYSINIVNSTVAGFIVVYNATAAPTSGTTLTAANTPYCMPVAASQGFDKTFQVPTYLSTGVTLLFSTSCTTYTPTGTAPVTLSGQAK